MAKWFLSYSAEDASFARYVFDLMRSHGADIFMAECSLAPGDNWSARILGELRSSSHVLFLASSTACRSPYVQQELGGAVLNDKEIIPVVWDMPPSQLPGWINGYQAVDLRTLDEESVDAKIRQVTESAPDENGYLLAIAVLGLTYLAFLRPAPAKPQAMVGIPTCPNCSTESAPSYMTPIPVEFREIEDASHECTKCRFKMKVEAAHN